MKARKLSPREVRTAAYAGRLDVSRAELAAAALARPRRRSDCAGGARPCPFVSCRHHLAVEARPSGSVWFPFGEEAELEDLPDTCALDVADRGGLTLEEVAKRLNITRQRADQEVRRAITRVALLVRLRRLVE